MGHDGACGMRGFRKVPGARGGAHGHAGRVGPSDSHPNRVSDASVAHPWRICDASEGKNFVLMVKAKADNLF